MSRQAEIDKIMILMATAHSRKSVKDAPPEPTFRDYAELLVDNNIRSKDGFEQVFEKKASFSCTATVMRLANEILKQTEIAPIDYKEEEKIICAICKKPIHIFSVWIVKKDNKDIGSTCTDCANELRSKYKSDVKTMTINMDEQGGII